MSDRDRVSAESAYASSVDSIQTEGPPSGRPFQSHLTQLLLTWNVTRSFVRSVIRPRPTCCESTKRRIEAAGRAVGRQEASFICTAW